MNPLNVHASPDPARKLNRQAEETTVWISCILTLTVLWVVVLGAGYQRQQLDTRERTRVATSTANGFAEYLSLRLFALDHLLVNSRAAFMHRGSAPGKTEIESSLGPISPLLLQVAFSDARGHVVSSSRPFDPKVSIADRPHFLEFRNDPRDRAFLSQPVVDRVSGKMSLQLARPLLGPAHEFRGVAVASVDPAQFRQYFGWLDAFADDGTVVILGRKDGVVRTRFSEDTLTWGQSFKESSSWQRLSSEAAGAYEIRSEIDGSQRIVGFHEVAGFPLVVLVTSRKPGWFSPAMPLIVALGIALTALQLRYTWSRVRRLRAHEAVVMRLERARQRELEADRMKSQFIASVSHELKTPLNTIVGFSELMSDTPGHPETGARARRVHGSAIQLQGMVDSLLELARIEGGDTRIGAAEVDLAQTVRVLVRLHASAARRQGMSLRFEPELPSDAAVLADTDRAAFVRALEGILKVAVRSSGPGGVRVGMSEHEGSFIVDVSASGADSPGAAAFAAPRESMRVLGGSLDLWFQPGAGTRATLRLPGARLSEVSMS